MLGRLDEKGALPAAEVNMHAFEPAGSASWPGAQWVACLSPAATPAARGGLYSSRIMLQALF